MHYFSLGFIMAPATILFHLRLLTTLGWIFLGIDDDILVTLQFSLLKHRMSVRVVRKTDWTFFSDISNSLKLYQTTVGCTRRNAELILHLPFFLTFHALIVTPTPRLLLLLGQRSAPKYRDAVRAQTWAYFQFMTETRQTPKYWCVLLP